MLVFLWQIVHNHKSLTPKLLLGEIPTSLQYLLLKITKQCTADAMSRIRAIQSRDATALQLYRKKICSNQSSLSMEDEEKVQIQELLLKLPKLDNIFNVHRKIGEGTFSSVYLGSLKQHSALPDSEKRWFAIKHLVPTSHPARIEQELRCLQEMGGQNHVIGVELCLRHLDTIVFIMPYIPHRKFSEYVGEMDVDEVKCYMRALLMALKHVHSFKVIHRDVKPSNFLYDRLNRRYLLVDFGLAQRLCEPPPPAHTTAGLKRPRHRDGSPPVAKRVALDLSVGSKRENVIPRPLPVVKEGCAGAGAGACACAGVGGVCGACVARPAARAARAGTQGFRPPEVLLKYPHQTTAVDVWAAGVVLASLLAARHPFFRASDDVSALAEVASLLGADAVQRAATALGRRVLMSGGNGCGTRGMSLRSLASPAAARRSVRFPEEAFALAARLLDPLPHSRISAADALAHPFLAKPGTK